jgi:acetylornithine deacetylase/succinyl-diaminopimelate desuccinylase-like protein
VSGVFLKKIKFSKEQKSEYLDDLFEFLRIPSITRDTEAVKKAAEWIYEYLEETADNIEIIYTKGNPVIIAEWKLDTRLSAKTKVPTILFYGHYDVQPPEPLEEWISPSFEPEIRNGRIYARGVGDNKGQLLANVLGILWVLREVKMGANVKFVFDGEEELGSPNLEDALTSRKEFFKDVDLIIVSDGPADPTWKPVLEFGARGIQTFQIHLQTAQGDVHSGNFGGIQPNPVWDVITLLKTMRDDNGYVTIDNYYRDTTPPSKTANEAARKLDRKPETYKEQLGISYFGGEQDLPLEDRLMFRPTLNIRGIKAGEVQENAKTMIPKEVIVEIDMRLVPHQTPQQMVEIILNHFEKLKQQSERYAQIIDRCKITFDASFHPVFTPMDLPWTSLLKEAITEGFNEEPLLIPMAGGSLPLYSLQKVTNNKPMYIIPYAQPDEDNHAPNENMMVDWFLKGIKTAIYIIEKIGTGSQKS